MILIVGEVEKLELKIVKSDPKSEKLEPEKLLLRLNVEEELDLRKLLKCPYCRILYNSNEGLSLELYCEGNDIFKSLIEIYGLEIGDKLELTFDENGELKKVSFVG